MIEFGREICGELASARRREWLATNGVGGYAMGTVSGILTRRYHGLLVAALKPPLGRTLLLTKLDETAFYDGRSYLLSADQWSAEKVEPNGYSYLQSFRLEGTIPVWMFALGDALLEKCIWMEYGANTTYVRYTLVRGSLPLQLSIRALANSRDSHANTHTDAEPQISVKATASGLRVSSDAGTTLYLISDRAEVNPANEWRRDYYLPVEAYSGLDPLDNNCLVGVWGAEFLRPNTSITFAASSESIQSVDGEAALARRRAYDQQLIEQAEAEGDPDWIKQLVLAADQFIVRRSLPDQPDGRTVIAGYPWFSDWGRDTMIALPGLTISTKRYEDAVRILRTFARFVDQGMLPNRFPDVGEQPEYNTVDATLWYFQAIRQYHKATGDNDLLRELFPVLQSIIDWHLKGTRYHIHFDPADGLLYAGQADVQLTWMDVKIGGWVVTPRTGKAVEINALWYNALLTMTEFARRLALPTDNYERMAERVRASFGRFWNADAGFCYDVIDSPDGDDAALRPNQLFAVSLPHSPLTPEQQRSVVDVCARKLITSYGLRSLSPDDPRYSGHFGGDQRARDSVYHQGTVWSWPIGAFVEAHWRVYGDRDAARSFLLPFADHLRDHGLGSISEIFDGDPPFTPRGCIAQAWGVAEVLRAWRLLAD